MPRGGERAGKPGSQYSNRGDLQTSPRTAGKEKVYGDVAQQRAVTQTPDAGALVPPPPGSLPPLVGPSDRPDEPVTAGLRQGPGPGPEALVNTGLGNVDPDLEILRALYLRHPFEGLRRMIERAEAET